MCVRLRKGEREKAAMGSREKDDSTPHQPLLSSLVVRPADSGGPGGGVTTGAGGAGSDYEPGEVRRDVPPPYSRSGRFPDDHGFLSASFYFL